MKKIFRALTLCLVLLSLLCAAVPAAFAAGNKEDAFYTIGLDACGGVSSTVVVTTNLDGKLPACYAVIDENEMTYLDGGATIADSDAYKAFLNVGQVFNQLARIFSGASSIINNINVIYKSIVELNNLLGGFIKK